MGKTRAEIQKAYRERKKEREGETYLAKERKRRMLYYVSSDSLSKKEKMKRNKLNRERVQKHRDKKRAEALAERQAELLQSPSDTSGYDTVDQVASPANQAMIVRMNFPNPRRAVTRRRISRALAKANKAISQLKIRNITLERKYKTLQKCRERLLRKVTRSPRTPKSKTDHDLQKAGISKSQGGNVRRQLMLGNALLGEIEVARSEAGNRKNKEKTLHSLVCGKIIKKYRGLSWLSARTGMNRNKLGKAGKKWTFVPKQSRNRIQNKYRKEVEIFMERDDNSRCQPGKADAKCDDNGEKVQTRVLTDYLENVHRKFLSENPSITFSLATFCRMRPRHILTTSFISRSSCLCTKHQNMALLLKSMRSLGFSVSANPDTFIKTQTLSEDDLTEKVPPTFALGQWKRVEVIEKGRKKSVMRIVETEIEKSKLIAQIKSQTADFTEHVSRVKTQYEEIRRLKEHLTPCNMVVQMDFAENYSCKSVEEIQSAYWNQSSVTLHPVVAYFKQNDQLRNQSFVVVSDELSHSSSTVYAILKAVLPELKSLNPDLKAVHYWTDGPTSQYRNKQIFYTVANHLRLFDMTARWNYFEVGHGKGPCDGLGGTTKRMADEAVRSGKTVIQDAKDFMSWAVNSSMKEVKFLYVSTDDCQQAQSELETRNVKVLKGTFKVHAVTGLGNSNVAVRDVSCYCKLCLDGDVCDTWKKENLEGGVARGRPIQHGGKVQESTSVVGTPPQVDKELAQASSQMRFSTGDFIAAVYEGDWYVGKIVDTDDEDDEVEVTFLVKKKAMFQWPKSEDIIWISRRDVLCKIDCPLASGKSKRMLKLSEKDGDLILMSFQALGKSQ